MMLLRKDGLDLIAIPQPGHARVGQRALRSADALSDKADVLAGDIMDIELGFSGHHRV
jgi:hypothetical protein